MSDESIDTNNSEMLAMLLVEGKAPCNIGKNILLIIDKLNEVCDNVGIERIRW